MFSLRRRTIITAAVGLLVLASAAVLTLQGLRSGEPRPSITLDYPTEGALFPADFAPPTLEWHDACPDATRWIIEVTGTAVGSPVVRATADGIAPPIGDIDPDAVGPTNKPPVLAPDRAGAHSWKPDAASWEAIKRLATGTPARITILGLRGRLIQRTVSIGHGTIGVSSDPVGAPILYRDVPLMPSAGARGVIQPLSKNAMPLIAWRLRQVSQPGSDVLMKGLHSCTNCHSVSRDGTMMGLDVDGPHNNKGLYALFPIRPETTIRSEDVIQWSTFRGKLGGKLRVAFMSQVSPDGRHVITMMSDPGRGQSDYQRTQAPSDLVQNYYVANFADYRFLQVFYPTRGVLAWYSKATGLLKTLPGADDPAYVHTGVTWSPDGQYLVFSRAKARASYVPGVREATYANDPNETQIQFDLYRMPFNGGRGGTAVPITGASANGMSNSFPKVSPDGRWIVFVQARNGQLMRPDSKLYIVPAEGGEARPLRANTSLMNSWHSFSPNGRWLVFTSKSRTPYTEMFLTHVDADGNTTPPVVIEHSTAANRAVNIPEFVNIAPGGLRRIEAPVTDYYRLVDLAAQAADDGRQEEALRLLGQAVASNPDAADAHDRYACQLVAAGRGPEALAHFRTAITLSPDNPETHNNLGWALAIDGHIDEAATSFRQALALRPGHSEAAAGLGSLLAERGQVREAIPLLEQSIEANPKNATALTSLCMALSKVGRPQDAIAYARRVVELSNGQNPLDLVILARLYAQVGKTADAIESTRRALTVATQAGADAQLVEDLRAQLAVFESERPFHP